jgi:hypothetical protein
MKNSVKLIIAVAVVLALSIVGLVSAQGNQTVTPTPETAFDLTTKEIIYVAIGWFIYTILGLIEAVIKGEPFDPLKFGKTFVWALIVMFLAIGFKITPVEVTTEYPTLVSALVDLIINSGAGMALIYAFQKIYGIITGFVTTLKKTATASSA